ncbi:MAG TPA: TonB-dependent receptor [Noviherbaspirillum sp.]|nr:TonB-dependent receptor [Noviherbaspirillum sp.]
MPFRFLIMNTSILQRTSVSRPLVLVAAISSLFLLPADAAIAQAQQARVLSPVTVSGTRFETEAARAPIGASVISGDEIREAGINNVNEAIRRLGGVHGRLNFAGTQDYSLDLRGFGTNSDQNLVILVDGIRLNENELSPALLSSIPIESVERIEIVRGGSSVLYGEGATGGTIQIITRRGAARGLNGTVVGEAGSLNHRELRASVAYGWDGFSIDAHAGTQRADNFRENNDVRLDNFSGGLQWASAGTRLGLRIDASRQDSRFAGPLSLAQFRQNPRQTLTPDDFGSFDSDRYTFFAEQRVGAFDFAAELSRRERRTESSFGGFAWESDSKTTQFSPRLRHRADFGGVGNELVAGVDVARWERSAGGTDDLQRSRAVYVRDEVRIGEARIAAGARREVFDQESAFGAFQSYDVSRSLNAWELQGSYAFAPTLNVFAKTGRSFRVANADEHGFTATGQPLAPQTSRDLELGVTLGQAGQRLTARVFQHRLRNEIFFDPTAPNAFGGTGANANLDPTRRRGVELEGQLALARDFLLSASFQHVSAEFTGGANAGNEMVLVPRNTALARLHWTPGSAHSAYVGLQWTDSQRYGGDFANACTTRIPSYTLLDARYAYRTGPWEFAVVGTNLTDRRYFSNAFGACESGIYPDPGRQVRVTVRYDF